MSSIMSYSLITTIFHICTMRHLLCRLPPCLLTITILYSTSKSTIYIIIIDIDIDPIKKEIKDHHTTITYLLSFGTVVCPSSVSAIQKKKTSYFILIYTRKLFFFHPIISCTTPKKKGNACVFLEYFSR